MAAYTYVYTSASAVYLKSGLSATEIDLTANTDIIEDAENEVNYLTGRKWTSANTKTEFFNGTQKDILGISGNKTTSINLTEYPVQSITEFKTLDTNGNAITTYALLTSVQIAAGTFKSTDYWLDVMEESLTHSIVPYGKINLISDEFPVGVQNIKVSYTYGYTSVPTAIRTLASCLAGIRAWVSFIGGQYNRLNSYSIPQQNVDKGDFYQRGKDMIEMLTTESERILDRIGRRPRTLFTVGGVK